MRLINSTTFELCEFLDRIPHYAILSHRWEDGEVSFQDFQQGKGSSMKGWNKIMGCCNQAKKDGWMWVWVDSCCIDKTSSSELSEAINSMFVWYKRAEICYVFLSDVSSDPEIKESQLEASKWFTRGWTLQELLAPRWLEFYSSSWDKIGTKSSLAYKITRATGISDLHLFGYQDASTAQKMSWASKRNTTRVEDEAYCLMGLFNINMPLLYGEGRKAFYRLQVEVLKQSDDESIFAWISEDPHKDDFGLLALSPLEFQHSGNIKRWEYDGRRPPITVNNKGLQLEVFLTGSSSADQVSQDQKALNDQPQGLPQPEVIWNERRVLYMVLNCKLHRPSSGVGAYIRVPLYLPSSLGIDDGNYNSTKGWSRRGRLDISLIAPSSSSRNTRLLLFAKTFSIPDEVTQKPMNLRVELPSNFPFKFVSSHQTFTNGVLNNKWVDATPGSQSLSGFSDDGAGVFLFQGTSSNSPGYFGLVVVAEPFSVYIIPDVREAYLVKGKCRYFQFYMDKKDAPIGDWTSQVLSGGAVVRAVHKKAIVETGFTYAYTYVVSLSADLITNRSHV